MIIVACLVPSIEIINKFPKSLEPGERALMDALLVILDDDWTIYVQPNLNGVQPDIIIFSEEAGMGVFEVKDWNLDSYRVKIGGRWDVYDGKQGKWIDSAARCPLSQVKSYKDSIYRYELPELEAEKILDKRVYHLIAPFVYFHCHTGAEARKRTEPVYDRYITVFGNDDLQPARLRALLSTQYLEKGSLFAEMMKRYQFQNRLRNALDYPEHGRLRVTDILFPLTPKQRELLANDPGRRRVIGAAGSGKTLIVARKAVNAALAGQKVLLVVFNITMVNYLVDVVRRLARFKSRNGLQLDKLIYVRHYHRLYTADIGLRQQPVSLTLEDEDIKEVGLFDVILIDEGQDFKREWIEHLYELAEPNAHVMFLEDDRQNIYGIDTAARRVVPGIKGQPNLLKRTFRINHDVAALANRLIAWSKLEFESGDAESASAPPAQGSLLEWPKPVWMQGYEQQMLLSLEAEIRHHADETRSGAPADLVILVCTVQDGWAICQRLAAMSLPYICNFESRDEFEKLAELYDAKTLKLEREKIRRARKIAFRMQTGRIKVCTIHSFKGWELKRVLIYFRLHELQYKERIQLLYTAITRAQDSVAVFNAEPTLFAFGQLAAQEGLVAWREPPAGPAAEVIV